jgi:hypothetical protein
MNRRSKRTVLPKGAMTMALAIARAHGERSKLLANAAVAPEATNQDDYHKKAIQSSNKRSLRALRKNNKRILEATTVIPVDDNKMIDTTMNSSVSYAGSMFDIKAKDNIAITSIGFHTSVESEYMKVQLYTREGSYMGCDSDISKWTLQADVTIQGRGLNNLTFLPVGAFDPILVRRKEVLGIYITTDQANLRVDKGTAEGEKITANSELIIYEGVGKRYPIERATFGPRVWNGAIQYGLVDIPTLSPATTMIPSYYPTMEPTLHPVKEPEPDVDSFRLRLYWEKGYFWQETNDEFWWCMECRDSCLDGDSVYIDECDSSIGQQFIFMGDTIRPGYDTSLCLTNMGYTQDTPMRFMSCTGQSDQSFRGMAIGEKFEFHQKGDSDHCVSQNHHPKSKERVYPEKCSLTRIHETSFWITY